MGHAELEPADIDESISPFYGALKRTWIIFCATSSIHGLKYARDAETNRVIRVIWLLITIMMFICAIAMVLTFYIGYRSNPTRINVENDHAPVSTLLFPAISICPEVMHNTQQSTKYIETLKIFGIHKPFIRKLPPLINARDIIDRLHLNYGFMNDDESFAERDIKLMENILRMNNLTVIDFIDNLRWNCNDLILRCRYHWNIINCNELFQVSRTYFGHCCSFNLHQTGMNFTAKYIRPSIQDGLSLILYYNESNYDQGYTYSHGFKLILHDNDAFPSSHAIVNFVALNNEVFIAVTPKETIASEAVKKLSFEERQCVLSHENHLQYFNKYLNVNCKLNCYVEKMLKLCTCLPYFIYTKQRAGRVCSYSDIPCLTENFADIVGRFRNAQCYCPNSCEMVDYNVQLTNTILDLNVPTVDEFYDDIKMDYAVVHVFINSQIYRRLRRDLLSNVVTLVSNLGSAFSLFVGMSMVSVVEIIFYFTFILRKYYRQEVKAREMLLFKKTAKIMIIKQEDNIE